MPTVFRASWTVVIGMLVGAAVLMMAKCTPLEVSPVDLPRFKTPTRSTSIVLTSDDRRLVVVNRQTNSVSILEVRDSLGADAALKLAELPVGQDPRCVAVSPDDTTAYVTNSASGTVSVIGLGADHAFEVITEIAVGTEPRGCALTPNGTRLFVANHASGTVSVIDTATRTVVNTVTVGGNPMAVAITNDGDLNDGDETVFITQFYAELVPTGPGEGFDEGKRGLVHAFSSGTGTVAVTRIGLSPIANAGFTADRTDFCAAFNPAVHSEIFCPDASQTDPLSAVIVSDPQGAFPNQLYSCLIRGQRLFVPSIGAGPEPPVQFSANTQALVHSVNTRTLAEEPGEHLNLNEQIQTEAPPADPTTSLAQLFADDLVALDADRAGSVFLLVSRGGNCVLRAERDANGRFDIGAPTQVQRFATGNIPSGVVISGDGRRAYVNNEVNVSVTAIDLEAGSVITTDIPSGSVPQPGTFEHGVLVGKLVFHTALGTPDGGLLDKDIRQVIPLASRGKASASGWSSCASCHPDGLSDGVTWIMADGPRQTVPLDAFFAKGNAADQRIAGWSADRGSVVDFNKYARDVQGGTGFAGDPPDPDVYDHGITQGASEALDALTLWVQTVRPLLMPTPTDTEALARGRALFDPHCASCHGGAKWTKSQVVYADNPAFWSDPSVGGVPRDPGVANVGAQIVAYTSNGINLTFMEDVGTFDPADPGEIRGAGSLIGGRALGAATGFNVPSLLGVGYHAPYLHNGAAETLAEVFLRHRLGAGTIATVLTETQRQDLDLFLRSIDGRTEPLRSDTDAFRDSVAN